MFTLTQTSASSLTLLSKLVHTALSVPDRPPEVFSSPTNTATNLPLEHNARIVMPKPIKMNTCIKTGEGWEAFRDLVFAAPAFLILMESYSCTKTMNNSHEIMLFQKNRGGGAAPEALLERLEFWWAAGMPARLLARKNGVLSTAHSDFGSPYLVASRQARR